MAQLDAAASCTVTRSLKAATFPDTGNVQDSCIVFAEVSFKQIRQLPSVLLPIAHFPNQHRSLRSFVAAGSSSVTRCVCLSLGVPCRFSYIACSTNFSEGIFTIEAYVFIFALSSRLPIACFLPSRRKPEAPARSAPTPYCTPILHARTFSGYPKLRL